MVEGKGAARLRASKPLVRRGRWAQPMEGEEMEPEDNEAGEAEAGRRVPEHRRLFSSSHFILMTTGSTEGFS